MTEPVNDWSKYRHNYTEGWPAKRLSDNGGMLPRDFPCPVNSIST